MREYGKIAPTFWNGETGKKIRKAGRDAQVVACYLVTAPSSNMLGMYYLPIPVIVHEVGITPEGALKALRSLLEAGFAQYDEASEHVFVFRMAYYQVGDVLKAQDNRVISIKKQLENLRKIPFFNQFLDRYREAFHLHDVSPSEGPSKPLRSQEQDQDHLQEHCQEKDQNISASVVPTSRRPKVEKVPWTSKTAQTWDAYTNAYKDRYGAEPVRNAKVNGILSRFVERLGEEEAPLVAAFYLTHNRPIYVSARHATDLLLRDAEGLRTEWVTGTKSTTSEARNAEHRDNVIEQVKRVTAQIQQERGAL